MGMDRRDLLKNSLALGGLAGLGGCAARPLPPAAAPPVKAASSVPLADRVPPLALIRAHTDRLFDIKVCIRPFRTKGPNLDVEQIGDTMVVHNYGHGGSGWSLSWGSADMAVQKAMSRSPKQTAVVGCGIIGLTSAITAQRAGAQVFGAWVLPFEVLSILLLAALVGAIVLSRPDIGGRR